VKRKTGYGNRKGGSAIRRCLRRVHGLMYGPLFETYQSPTDSPDEAKRKGAGDWPGAEQRLQPFWTFARNVATFGREQARAPLSLPSEFRTCSDPRPYLSVSHESRSSAQRKMFPSTGENCREPLRRAPGAERSPRNPSARSFCGVCFPACTCHY
jgi:hypothetical protein